MLKKIEYENKIAIQNDESIPTKGKVTDDDMNEIKEVVNNNADELENKQPKEEGKGLSEENFTTQLKQKLEDLKNFDDTVILQKIENLTKEQTEQNSKISILEEDSNINKTKVEKLETSDKLQTDDIKLLQQKNQQIKSQLEEINNLLPKGKFEGEEVTITDSAEHSFKELTIEGNSWQETNEKMPSPEYPSRIRNVGDNINLFNKDGNVIHSYESKLEPIETGVKVTLKIVGTSRYCVMKLGGSELLGKTLVAHGNTFCSGKNDTLIGYYFGTDNNFLKKWIIDSGNIRVKDYKYKQVFTIPDTFPEGCNSIYIILYANGISTEAKVGDYVEYRDFKIEEDAQATPYSPYNCGNTEVTISNKNMFFDGIKSGLYLTANGNYTTSPNYVCSNEFQNVDTNKTYVVSSKTKKEGMYFINEYNEEGKFIKSQSSISLVKEFKFQVERNTKKIHISLGNSGSPCTVQNTIDFSLEINNTSSDYIEHEEQSIIFPLKEGQVLHKGDFLAADGVHHLRKTVVLDGTEDWVISTLNDYQWFRYNLTGVKLKSVFICTHLKNYSGIGNYIGISNNSSVDRIYLAISEEITTVEQLKAYMAEQKQAGTPVTLEYELAEPIIEPYTEEQQNVYNQIIKTAKTYKGTTHIFSQDEINPVFKGEYFKDLEILLSNQTGGGN